MTKVKTQHYDMKPGTEVFKVKVSDADTKAHGTTYWVVTTEKDVTDPAMGTLRTVPESKLEEQ
jgi:hypothetical protein